MSGNHSRNKGAGFERELVNDFKDRGLKAQRVPLSGATGYAKNDVEVQANFQGKPTYSGECKRRKNLPKWIMEALDGADFVAMRGDRGEALIVLRLEMFGDLLQ